MNNIETTERKRIILYFPKYTHQPLEAIVCERAVRVAELNMPVISFNHLFFHLQRKCIQGRLHFWAEAGYKNERERCSFFDQQ